MDKALLLVNTGTPDDPGVRAVRRYLSEFLNDPMVIDLPWILRKFLVNMIIVPFRATHSSELYRSIWTTEGSPLKINHEKLTAKLRQELHDYHVFGAMRYGNPSLKDALEELRKRSVKKITVLPLFPQYASSTTGSVIKFVRQSVRKWKEYPEIIFIDQFYSHPAFIRAYAERIKGYNLTGFDHILFSYHSLPLSHLRKVHSSQDPEKCTCESSMPEYGSYCYKAACYETSRLLAVELDLKPGTYSTSFQSRLTKKWISPFTDQILKKLAGEGKKRVLVAAPSFTADCLETISEIGNEYRNSFINSGGTKFVMTESLNYTETWIKALTEIITETYSSDN
jgi:ferrochelatase